MTLSMKAIRHKRYSKIVLDNKGKNRLLKTLTCLILIFLASFVRISASDNLNYDDSIKIELLKLKKYEEISDVENIANTLNDISYLYRNKMSYSKALYYAERCLELLRENNLDSTLLYCDALCNQSILYCYIGDFNKSYKLRQEELVKTKEILGEKSLEYAISLHNYAILLVRFKDYTGAELIQKEVLSIMKDVVGDSHEEYINSLLLLSVIYYHQNRIHESLTLCLQGAELYKKTSGYKSLDYAYAIELLADNYVVIEEYRTAIKYYKKSLRITKKLLGEENESVMTLHSGLCDVFLEMKEYKKALKHGLKARVVSINTGEETVFYRLLCERLFEAALHTNNAELCKSLLNELFEISKKELFHKILFLPTRLREVNWDNGYGFMKFLRYANVKQEFVDIAFNTVLLHKSFLLNFDIELLNFVTDNSDEKLNSLFSELRTKKEFLNHLYEIPVKERTIDSDSLKNEIEQLEENFLNYASTKGDMTNKLSVSWEQVQKALNDDELAIEFVSFPINDDSVMYCALTLKKGYDAPKMTPLFESSQLDSVNREKCYESTVMAELVWKPLDEELKEAKNIYFAPDGELYNIAIESLPYHDGVGYMFDRWNLYRLSSTRELAKIKYHPSETKAALYGGLNYDTDITTIENSQQPFDELYIAQYRSEPDSIGLRARYGTLRGTWTEVQLIDSLYSNLKYPSKVYAHNIGTETSLKKLDGQKISNLHIATHGFYWTETELNEKEDLRELPFMRDNNRPRFVEDKAMTRSGLLFAGANNVLSGKTIPEGYDDGILTAKEISTLDLRGLDLLVLSACQTGLGEIKGDGVYGLQRGFKMAGAQTIVMSLWKVDDDATQMLMTEFYRRYLSGQSKHEAFLAAQEAVRNFKGKIRGKDRNFSDPKYWAGFVMLD